jgi:hypothetical protein
MEPGRLHTRGGGWGSVTTRDPAVSRDPWLPVTVKGHLLYLSYHPYHSVRFN